MQEYYKNLAALKHNSLLEMLVFQLNQKQKGLQDNFCLLDCDSAFEKFQQTIIDEVKH